jgi:polyisoprenoid-binding protein YceI
MRNVASLAVFSYLAVTGTAQAAGYTVDADHSSVGFSVKHLMITDVHGSITKFSGDVVMDDKDVTKSTVNVQMDPASISTMNEKRDGHLKAADFLDTAKFPAMTFKSTKVAKKGKQLLVTGDLTIRDVTKPVVLTVEGLDKEVQDPWGNTRTSARATGKINRYDYGLKWNQTLEKGGVLVGEEVGITLDVQLIKKK